MPKDKPITINGQCLTDAPLALICAAVLQRSERHVNGHGIDLNIEVTPEQRLTPESVEAVRDLVDVTCFARELARRLA